MRCLRMESVRKVSLNERWYFGSRLNDGIVLLSYSVIASDKFRLVEALTNPTASNGEDFGGMLLFIC